MSIINGITERVEQHCLNLIGAREMFTAWTVTCLINEENKKLQKPEAEHYIIKAIVHSFYFKGGMGQYYMRSLAEVRAPRNAWVYHHSADDPKEFKGDTPIASTDVLRAQSQTSTMSIKEAKASAANVIKSVDNWNRLRVPANVLREAGIEANDHVWVYYDSDQVVLSTGVPSLNLAADHKMKGMAVDQYCNIRLAMNTLGMDAESYEMKPEFDKVVIVPVD